MNMFVRSRKQNGEKRPLERHDSLARLYILSSLFFIGFAAVVLRLIVIQIRDSQMLCDQAHMQYESREILPALRGLILDRNLSILASNTIQYMLVADPSVIKRPDTAARYLARYMPHSAQYYLTQLKDTTRRYVVLEKGLPESASAYFVKWECRGVWLRSTPRRRYNFGSLAGSLVGYTNVDNEGQSGIELQFEQELAGMDGYIVYRRNARGYRRPDVEYPRREPVDGRSVVLTISQAYQSIAEEELARGVDEHKAASGRCIILQPRTGEVLAMANYPGFDPNDMADYAPEKARNRIITDIYEPGSTFKLITMSSVLNEHVSGPDDVFFGENGAWKYSQNVKAIEDTHGYGNLTLRQAFQHSSNIVSAKVAERVGDERFFKYARNFGFGVQTGIELPGELRGDLKKPVNWAPNTLKYLAFGYGLSATAMQLACAYAAVANDGILMRPYIRRWLLDGDRNIVDETVPQSIRRVVSEETASTMRSFLRTVVDSGTARSAHIDGIAIGGKTGTSRCLVNGEYSDNVHNASFVGFFPVDNPKILILVMLEAPSVNGYYGGTVAGPIFKNIALRIISSTPEFAKKPDPILAASGNNPTCTVPDLRGLTAAAAQRALGRRGLASARAGSGTIVLGQTPQPGATVAPNGTVTLTLAARPSGAGTVAIPAVEGLSVRQALTVLRMHGLSPSPSGSGRVTAQLPPAGERVPRGTRCTLLCEPRRVITARLY